MNRKHLFQKRADSLSRTDARFFRNRLEPVLFVLLPFICVYITEAFTHNPWTMPPQLQVVNAGFYLLILLLLQGLLGRFRAAAFLSIGLAFFIGLANYMVLSFRGSPILPWDLLSLTTALHVRGDYKLSVGLRFWLVTAAALLAIGISMLSRVRVRGFRQRLVLVAVSLLLLTGYTMALQQPVITKLMGFNTTLFTPDYLYRNNGFVASFISNLRFMEVDEPADYSRQSVTEITRETRSKLSDDRSSHDESGITDHPHILVIMNETFADMSVLGDFPTNKDFMPFFRSLQDNTIRGNLHVSVVGGNTATTEFEFLTGNSMAFLPSGSVAYQQYIQDDIPALPTVLHQLGYKTTAMHPYPASGWNRDEVYGYLGFDSMFFLEDFAEAEHVRNYVSDRAVYDRIIQDFESRPTETPLFTFAVTMQNHGGYQHEYPNFTPDIQIPVPGDDEEIFALEQYLSLLHVSDQALEDFIQYFDAVDDDTVILFFGDHQPHDPVVEFIETLSVEQGDDFEAENRMIVPFAIWANFDIKEQRDVTISVNYLSSLLLDAIDMPQSGYGHFLSDAREELPVVTATYYLDSDGNRYAYGMSGEPVADNWLHEYEILQYNYLFDPENQDTAFFEEPVSN